MNDNQKIYSYDHPMCDIYFELVDFAPIGMAWSPAFSHVKLGPLKKVGKTVQS